MKRYGFSVMMALSLGACSAGERLTNGEPPTAPGRVLQPVVGQVKVTQLRVYIKDRQPQAFVQGELGDGCTSLDAITRQRHGNAVDIVVTFKRVGEVCTMIFKYLNEWVPLDGDFEPGEYTVRANGVDVRFRLLRGADGALRVDPDPGPLPQPPYLPF